MPGCRKLDTPSSAPVRGERLDLSHYVRLRARPPRPANDNRRVAGPGFWHWAVVVGAAPMIGLLAALSLLL